MYTEQELENDLREASREAIKQVTAGFTYQGENPAYRQKSQDALALLGKHNGMYSARNNRAQVIINAARLVGASGPALAEALRLALPQAPGLADAANGSLPAADSGGTVPNAT
jgi:hypothetical protein